MRLLSTYAAAAMALETTNAFQAFSTSLNGGNRVGNPRSALPPRAWSPWGLSSTRRRPAPSPSPLVCSSQTSDVTTTAAGSTEANGSSGGAHGGAHGGVRRPKTDRHSFVQWDMRRAAMKLHTRDQAPKEGKQENKGVPFAEWRPSRRGYLQFLVDSKIVYEALEESCAIDPRLVAFRDTGLERSEALGKDIAWMIQSYPDATESTSAPGEAGMREGRIASGMLPPPTESAVEYAALLKRMVGSSLPAFVCHFYNHYFAHTAGGRMIGRKVAESCLDGRTLEFYKWRSDVKELLEGVRLKIDAMANGWSDEEKEACVSETARSFHYGGRLLKAITS